jgi:hypothetical protein
MRQSFQFCRILLTSGGLSFLSDLGAVLDHEEPQRYPASDHCSPSQDHQRSVAKRRRDERGLFAVQIRAHHEAALIDRGISSPMTAFWPSAVSTGPKREARFG